MRELTEASATELAARIRRRQVSAREVVEAHIARIARVNPTINAVVAERFEVARREADAADARTAREPAAALPPLHGVPCTIKESFALAGMPNSSGLVARRATIASTDATGVARLRAAGAIPLGVTNVSELCMWYESDNRVYGRTSNPYDPSRIVGGSSGGEGAIVGAGGSPFGLGSDIGGSIRLPAFFNGVFGHKASGGLIPGSGQYPMAEGAATRYLATGPLCRRAEDLPLLVSVLAGPDGIDPGCREHAPGDPGPVDLRGLTVYDVADNGVQAIDPELAAAQRRVADHLASRGARVEPARIPGLDRSLTIWGAMLSEASTTPFATMLGNGTPVRVGRELVRYALGRSPHTLPALGLAAVERLSGRVQRHLDAAVADGRALAAALAARLGPRTVLLYPSFTRPAPRHGQPLTRPFDFVYAGIFNVLEVPSTQVPLGLGRAGLPLGVQIVAGHGQDHLTMAVALELERGFGGWVPPST